MLISSHPSLHWQARPSWTTRIATPPSQCTYCTCMARRTRRFDTTGVASSSAATPAQRNRSPRGGGTTGAISCTVDGGSAFNLDWNVGGNETTSTIYQQDCDDGVTVELWSMAGSEHVPNFRRGSDPPADNLFANRDRLAPGAPQARQPAMPRRCEHRRRIVNIKDLLLRCSQPGAATMPPRTSISMEPSAWRICSCSSRPGALRLIRTGLVTGPDTP